jgi:hypothetical protein
VRLYHFLNAKYGLQAIRRQHLKIARISELNDPFEFLQVASEDPRTRARYQFVKRSLSEYMGLICLSENWKNPVQWSHYGQSHRGICLGFDVDAAAANKVRYVANRIPANLKAMRKDGPAARRHMLDLLTLKFDHWSYEQEHRVFVPLENRPKNRSGLCFMKFSGADSPLVLKEIIVGAASEVSPEEVNAALGRRAGSVSAFKARLAFRTFEVVAQRNRDLWRPSRRRVGLREPSFEALAQRALAEKFGS